MHEVLLSNAQARIVARGSGVGERKKCRPPAFHSAQLNFGFVCSNRNLLGATERCCAPWSAVEHSDAPHRALLFNQIVKERLAASGGATKLLRLWFTGALRIWASRCATSTKKIALAVSKTGQLIFASSVSRFRRAASSDAA
jgi:hypothetical protein